MDVKMTDQAFRKFQYSVNKKAEDILNWLEKDMYKIPPVDYKQSKIYYYTELNDNAIEVHYKAYDIQTREYLGGDIQFSFAVDEFDSSTSVITGNFWTRDIGVEKLAYTYLLNLGTVLNAEWKTEVSQHLEPSIDARQRGKPGRPKSQDDVWAWQQVNEFRSLPAKVYQEWINRESVKARNLQDPDRHFDRIIKSDYGTKLGQNI